MRIVSILLPLLFSYTAMSQQVILKTGNILHYKGTLNLQLKEDTSYEKNTISDYQIKVDSILKYNDSTVVVIFSTSLQSLAIQKFAPKKQIFLLVKSKIYQVYSDNYLKFLKLFSTDMEKITRNMKDTVTMEFISNKKDYVLIPYIDLNSHNTNCLDFKNGQLTFMCYQGTQNISVKGLKKRLDSVSLYKSVSAAGRISEVISYSPLYWVLGLNGFYDVQGDVYELNFKLFNITD